MIDRWDSKAAAFSGVCCGLSGGIGVACGFVWGGGAIVIACMVIGAALAGFEAIRIRMKIDLEVANEQERKVSRMMERQVAVILNHRPPAPANAEEAAKGAAWSKLQ